MEDEEENHQESISMVGPYARTRIIVAVVCIFIALAVIGYRLIF